MEVSNTHSIILYHNYNCVRLKCVKGIFSDNTKACPHSVTMYRLIESHFLFDRVAEC